MYLFPGRQIRFVQGIAQVDKGQQGPRIGIDPISALLTRQHRQEIALLLRGNPPAVAQFMGDGGGQQAGGTVPVQRNFPGKREVKSVELGPAHPPGKGPFLGPLIFHSQERIQPFRAPVNLRRCIVNHPPGHGKGTVSIPGHAAGQAVQFPGKISCRVRQFRRRDRPAVKPRLFLKSVGIVVHAPQQAERSIQAQGGASQRQKAGVKDLKALSPPRQIRSKGRQIQRQNAQSGGNEHLCHGKRRQRAQSAQGLLQRPGDPGHPIHQPPVLLPPVKQQQKPPGAEQPKM